MLKSASTWALVLLASAAATASLTVAAAAPETPAPSTAPAVALDAATLDRYVGQFQLSPTSLLTISRKGDQLSAQITGQPAFPIYADGRDEFHWQVVPARVSFGGDDHGQAITATVHQNGADIVARRVDEGTAAQVQANLAERVRSQQPQAGGETALRKVVGALATGAPDYADMTDALQGAVRQQKPAMEAFLQKLGPPQAFEFKGVSDAGADKYVVTHQNGGKSQWIIQLAADGRISTLAALPVF